MAANTRREPEKARLSPLVLDSPYRNGLRKWTLATCIFAIGVACLILYKSQKAERASEHAFAVATQNQRILNSRTPILEKVPAMERNVGVIMDKAARLHDTESRHARDDKRQQADIQRQIVLLQAELRGKATR